jgi:hypothetical protein
MNTNGRILSLKYKISDISNTLFLELFANLNAQEAKVSQETEAKVSQETEVNKTRKNYRITSKRAEDAITRSV